jgi:hypothetical protein
MHRISVIRYCRTFYFFVDRRGVVPRCFIKGPDGRGPQVVTSSIKDQSKVRSKIPMSERVKQESTSDKNI